MNLVGGYGDTAALRPWTSSTISNVFSVTKGVSAVVAALLVERSIYSYCFHVFHFSTIEDFLIKNPYTKTHTHRTLNF